MVINAIAVIVIFGLNVAGLLAIIQPRWVRTSSRWAGPGLIALAFVVVGLMAVVDGSDPSESSSDARSGGVVLMVFFGLLAWGLFKLAARSARNKAVDLRRPLEPAAPSEPKVQKKSWWDREMEKAARARADREQAAALRKEEKRKAKEEEQAAAAIVAEMRAILDADMSSDERLTEQFDRLQADEISLEEYQAAILDEGEDVARRLQELRSEKKWMDPEDYEFQLEAIDEDRQAVRWRLEWVKKKIWSAAHDDSEIEARGKWARFSYSAREGATTQREIVNWEKRGAYVVGYDRQKEAERTFRQDRISDWVAG